jgi:hypothetical protein
MGVFKSLGDAFFGNTAHWTRNHNPVVGDLFRQADTLSKNGPEIFKKLIVLSSFAAERLVFPREGCPLLNANLKSITRSHFDQLYATLLAFLVAKMSKEASEIGPAIKADLLHVVTQQQTTVAEKLLADIENAPAADLESVRLWKGVTQALGVTDHDIQKQAILYLLLVKSLASGL